MPKHSGLSCKQLAMALKSPPDCRGPKGREKRSTKASTAAKPKKRKAATQNLSAFKKGELEAIVRRMVKESALKKK